MIHPETHLVTKTHGPRPAGRPDYCFYCGQPVGENHKEDCVMRQRTVILRVTFEVVKEVPEGWTKEQIESQFGGEWSYCMDNMADLIGKGTADGCMCDWHIATSLVREADETEERIWYGAVPELDEK